MKRKMPKMLTDRQFARINARSENRGLTEEKKAKDYWKAAENETFARNQAKFGLFKNAKTRKPLPEGGLTYKQMRGKMIDLSRLERRKPSGLLRELRGLNSSLRNLTLKTKKLEGVMSKNMPGYNEVKKEQRLNALIASKSDKDVQASFQRFCKRSNITNVPSNSADRWLLAIQWKSDIREHGWR